MAMGEVGLAPYPPLCRPFRTLTFTDYHLFYYRYSSLLVISLYIFRSAATQSLSVKSFMGKA